MNRLWEAAGPLTVREMVDALVGRNLAYPTVMTVPDTELRRCRRPETWTRCLSS